MVAFSTILPLIAAAQSTPTIVWTGAVNSEWNNPANWDLGRIPNGSDSVAIVNGSNAVLNVSASIASLIMGADSGSTTQRLTFANNATLTLATNSAVGLRGELFFRGALNGAGLLEVRGLMQWATGDISSKLSIAEGGQLRFTGEYYPRLNSGVADNPAIITNRGTVTYPGGYPLYAGSGAQIYNYGEWRLEADGTALDFSGGAVGATFHNFGTITKTGGAGDSVFTSSLTILYGTGTVNASIGTVRFDSSTDWRDGNQVTGAGQVLLQGGNTVFSGTTTIQGSWVWNGVNITGNGTIAGPTR